MFNIQEIKYLDLINCVQLSNNFIDLVIPKEFGPRIVHFGFRGQPNMFNLNHEHLKNFRGSSSYYTFGGHRLWTAPEDLRSTYIPDNTPVEINQLENGIQVHQPENEKTPLAKTIDIELSAKFPVAHITHTIQNRGIWAMKFAPWALSVMAPGGMGIMPLPPRGSHQGNLLPNGSLVFWAYTNFADPRWRYGFENICVQQDPSMETPLKFGIAADPGWIGYANHGSLFVKKTDYFADETYPDKGTPYQIFLNHRILECESMGPLKIVEPGQAVVHEETWILIENITLPINDETIQENIAPRIQKYL